LSQPDRLHISNLKIIEDNQKFADLVDFIDKKLPDEWEIYVTPFLNGLNPDIVLLNNAKGIHVIDSGLRSLNIFARIKYLENQFIDLYCPRLKDKGKTSIFYSFADIELDDKEIRDIVNEKELNNFTFISKNNFENNCLINSVPLLNTNDETFCSEYADDIRSWLRVSDFKKNQLDEIITLDRHQRTLVDTRTETGFRRIRGAAGSGKTLVLAFKAARLISTGKSVLILTYNITLINYIRSLVFKGLKNYESSFQETNGKWKIQWFHNYAKNYFININRIDVWNSCYDKKRQDRRESNMVLVPERILQFFNDASYGPSESYDAVLVDEGSDFVPDMWLACKKLIKKGGEGYLVKDGSQDIYQRDSSWTDEVMVEGGFSGPWNFLKESYRMPFIYIPKIKDFIDMHLSDDEEVNYPVNEYEPDIFSECNTSWYQVKEHENNNLCLKNILEMMPLTEEFAYANILFLSLSIKPGKEVVNTIIKKGIKVAHTFFDSGNSGRSAKVAFDLSDEKIKATTVYSIKGFEGPMLVIQILPRNAGVSEAKQSKLVYTALTRLRLGMNSKCHINVICSDPLFYQYGKTWGQDFHDLI